jgi:hypothetical protein
MSASPVPVLLMVRELGIGGCERDVVKLAKAIDRSKFTPHVGCFVSQGLRYEELRATGTPIIRVSGPLVHVSVTIQRRGRAP